MPESLAASLMPSFCCILLLLDTSVRQLLVKFKEDVIVI